MAKGGHGGSPLTPLLSFRETCSLKRTTLVGGRWPKPYVEVEMEDKGKAMEQEEVKQHRLHDQPTSMAKVR
jgi:hypothetical protein